MRQPTSVGLASCLVAALSACGSSPQVDLESFERKSSYAVGIDIGRELHRTAIEFDLPSLTRGIYDVFDERELQLTDEEMAEVLRELSAKTQLAQAQRREEMLQQNQEEGDAFLAANGKKEGVITTASGLQYEVLTEGTGPKPAATDRVSVNYRGSLVDGSEFDSSERHGGPATFVVNQVIDGWTEALQLMSVGSKYRLAMPSELAYGENGSSPVIGPNATLIFEVELLEILQ